ncbi:MAG: SDR family oxidoreductase [Thermomicrobiales bacterium]|nr:SDR family oxidoreductase [Thermomicrobiales bacterium]
MGKTAVVTGAARGIGAAITDALLAAGVNVVINDFDEAGLRDRLATLPPERVAAAPGDVADEAVVAAMFDCARDRFGGADILVNNAGIVGPMGAFATSGAAFAAVLRTNVVGPFLCSVRAATEMRQRGGGAIVNLASTSRSRATRVTPIPAYDASKGAVANLTRALAVEWAPLGIRVNAVAPGPLETAMRIPLSPELEARKLTPVAMGRRGEPAEVADVVVFLASPAARYITGQVVCIDGGMTA